GRSRRNDAGSTERVTSEAHHPLAEMVGLARFAHSAHPTICSKWPIRPERFLLQSRDLPHALFAKLQQPIELRTGKGRFLAAALNLDVTAVTGHHQIQINFGVAILFVAQVELLL